MDGFKLGCVDVVTLESGISAESQPLTNPSDRHGHQDPHRQEAHQAL